MFTHAIVRPPAPNFAAGLTTAALGPPNYERALKQHQSYCAALTRCGLTVTRLEADPDYPDSTFVEDAAVITERCATLARPGAPSRAGEAASIRRALSAVFPALSEIHSPGTLDGGDVCEAGKHFFIGVSSRTNEVGAQQLAELLARHDYTASFVDIRNDEEATGSGLDILHLKSGLAYIGDSRLVVIGALADRAEFSAYDVVRVDSGEEYAANCVRVNDHLLVAAGYSGFEAKLRELGYQIITLEMSEFQKMDGGLSCLSLRF